MAFFASNSLRSMGDELNVIMDSFDRTSIIEPTEALEVLADVHLVELEYVE